MNTISNKKIVINHGISTSPEIYSLFHNTKCKIIKPGQRFYPMGVQMLKLDIHKEFMEGHGSDVVGLTYMADCLDCHDKQISIFLAEELSAELNRVFVTLCRNKTDIGMELQKEYLGLFPLVANDRGLYTVSIDLVPGGLDEYGCPTIKNKFFVTCRELDDNCRPACVFSCVWNFES